MKPVLLRGHEKPITVVKFNFDGDLLFTGAGEKRVNLWYSMSGERVGSFEPMAAVRTLDVTNDSKYLIVGTNVGTLEFFRVDGGQLLGHIEMGARLKTVQLSYGDQELLVLAEWYTKDKVGQTEFLVYDFEEIKNLIANRTTPQLLDIKPKTIMNFKSKYAQIGWNLLNKNILAAQEGGILELVDLEGKVIKSVRVFDEKSENFHSFSISKQAAFMIATSRGGAKLIDPEDLSIIKNFKTEVQMNFGVISPLAFNSKAPKYHGIIAGGVPAIEAALLKQGGFEVRIVSLVHEEEIGRIAGHFGPVNTLAFYPDGRGFVSGGEEGIVRLFRFDESYFKDKDFE